MVGISYPPLTMLTHWNVLLVRITVALPSILDIRISLCLGIHLSNIGIVVINWSACVIPLPLDLRVASISIHDESLFVLIPFLIISATLDNSMSPCL